ncbi:UNVERIFIED_CONTAM: hypothetical protein GTU68_056777, partial [Idotea baltica]|nr:hypothetical protein [Idotea baltica]
MCLRASPPRPINPASTSTAPSAATSTARPLPLSRSTEQGRRHWPRAGSVRSSGPQRAPCVQSTSGKTGSSASPCLTFRQNLSRSIRLICASRRSARAAPVVSTRTPPIVRCAPFIFPPDLLLSPAINDLSIATNKRQSSVYRLKSTRKH